MKLELGDREVEKAVADYIKRHMPGLTIETIVWPSWCSKDNSAGLDFILCVSIRDQELLADDTPQAEEGAGG